jgi:dolichyl-phosphate-mannose--protein O-mannosyl transferase
VRYPLAIISGSAIYAVALYIGFRSGHFDMVLFRYVLVIVSAIMVVAVSKPWRTDDRHSKSLLRLGAAWLATIGCVILVFAINYIFTFWYGCSQENCMP